MVRFFLCLHACKRGVGGVFVQLLGFESGAAAQQVNAEAPAVGEKECNGCNWVERLRNARIGRTAQGLEPKTR